MQGWGGSCRGGVGHVGRHSEAAHEKGSFVPKNVPGVWLDWVGHVGVGWVM